MSWNVQNLFDGQPQGTEYPPYGDRKKWSNVQIQKKLFSLDSALMSVRPAPDVYALQEVENKDMGRALADGFIAPWRRSYVFVPPRSQRPTVPIFITTKKPISVTWHYSLALGYEDIIGELVYPLRGGRSLYIFNNHWKSSLGDKTRDKALRLAEAQLLHALTEPLISKGEAVIALGDFNTTYSRPLPGAACLPLAPAGSSSCVLSVPVALSLPDLARFPSFLSVWPDVLGAAQGTFYFRKKWRRLDDLLLSSGVVKLFGSSLRVSILNRPPFLNPKTKRPWRYALWKNAGVSDHLPLLFQGAFL